MFWILGLFLFSIIFIKVIEIIQESELVQLITWIGLMFIWWLIQSVFWENIFYIWTTITWFFLFIYSLKRIFNY